MWTHLDDALIDHRKVFAAGAKLGKDGPAIAIGFYAVALMWTNKHLTDGVLTKEVIRSFPHVSNPTTVADALRTAGLFDAHDDGYRIHDFNDVNPSAAKIKRRRREDKLRKQREREANGGA
jgi:hypothetical protein